MFTHHAACIRCVADLGRIDNELQSHRIQVKPTLTSLARGNAADFLVMSQAEN